MPSTVWDSKTFSVTQILREINFGGLRSCKTAIFGHILGGLNYVNLVHFIVQKVKNPNSEPLNVKWYILDS